MLAREDNHLAVLAVADDPEDLVGDLPVVRAGHGVVLGEALDAAAAEAVHVEAVGLQISQMLGELWFSG